MNTRFAFWQRSILFKSILLVGFALSSIGARAFAWEPAEAITSGSAPLQLHDNQVNESSGLAFSLRNPHCVWTHNDSGDSARLFAFDEKGKACGRATLKHAGAQDWEDMAAFDDDGPKLLIADVGDNDNRRDSVSLYLLDEPDPQSDSKVTPYLRIKVSYANGSQNCESITVDVSNRKIYLLGKSAFVATFHEIPLPEPKLNTEADGDGLPTIRLETKAIRNIPIPMATGMALNPTTGDLWICSYLNGYQVKKSSGADLFTRLGQMPTIVELPKLKQIEAIAVDDSGRIWVSTEGQPAMIQRIR
ncbi:hypothetical protein [Stieleria sp. JC731]|uniref:hypothetical protein n=1 Tax=Pirellulaceae TaxID=2691357 RepID=UPI001E2D1725|nr:hypothetical protein [Stieleria sp. JC731]